MRSWFVSAINSASGPANKYRVPYGAIFIHESKRHLGHCLFSRRVRGPSNRSKPCRTRHAVFDRRIEPILRTHCLGCHNDKLKDGGISFTDRDGLIHGGAHGPAIVPGNPDASILIQAVRQDGALTMPPGGKLSPKDIATLTQWIKRGAAWGTKLRANDSPKSSICHLSGNKTERRADYRICAGL